MKARVQWLDGRAFVGESGSGHAVVMDGAPDSGGRNIGVRPMEMLLLGLGGCTAFDVVMILEKGRDAIHKDVAYFEAEGEEGVLEVALQWTGGYTEAVHSYANNINTHEGGTHLSGFRSALTRTTVASACLRTLDSASCTMCSAWTCASSSTATPACFAASARGSLVRSSPGPASAVSRAAMLTVDPKTEVDQLEGVARRHAFRCVDDLQIGEVRAVQRAPGSRGGPMRPNSIVNWFVAKCRKAGLEGCSSHSGRRTFITSAARRAHWAGATMAAPYHGSAIRS